jgi:DNA polymerase
MNTYGLEFELEPISKIHGRVFATTASYGPLSVVTLYHPAVALYNGSMRVVLAKDFEVLKEFI